MPFYKKDNIELLVALTRVQGPGYLLDAEQYTEYTYPVDGWYWFDNLEAAMVGMSTVPNNGVPVGVSMRQACLQLEIDGLLDDVEEIVATLPRIYQIEWQRASVVGRDNKLVEMVRQQKGMTEDQIDLLFIKASKL